MKKRVVFVLLVCLCPYLKALCQHPTELKPGYYIVVGAYAPAKENVAKNYTEVLTRRGLDAAYGFNSTRKYFYVYLRYFSNLRESLGDMQATRRNAEFSDAWVRVVSGDVAIPPAVAETKNEDEVIPVDRAVPQALDDTAAENRPSQPDMVLASASEYDDITYNPEIKQYKQITLGNTEVFLSLFNARNNRIVEGQVTVVDKERNRSIKEVKGNEYLHLPDPKSKSGQLTLVCEAFGYRKIQHEINFPMPLADTVKDYIDLMGTTLVVNFDLVRYHKGDIVTLFHVYFFNDAALMLPESKYELDQLLQMLQEDPNFRIRLHGHTNGNYHGRILTMGESKNLFSVEGSKSGLGSAKDLSYNRAAIIKAYLVENGIDESRIELKAWGGKRPLYDKHGANAKKNVRVEVEILEE